MLRWRSPGGLTGLSAVLLLSHSSLPPLPGAHAAPLPLPLALPPGTRALPAPQRRRRLGGVGPDGFARGYHGNFSLQERLQLADLALCPEEDKRKRSLNVQDRLMTVKAP